MTLGDSCRNVVLPLGNLVLSVELREQRQLRSIRSLCSLRTSFQNFDTESFRVLATAVGVADRKGADVRIQVRWGHQMLTTS